MLCPGPFTGVKASVAAILWPCLCFINVARHVPPSRAALPMQPTKLRLFGAAAVNLGPWLWPRPIHLPLILHDNQSPGYLHGVAWRP